MKAFEARECYKNCKICKHQDLSLNTPGMEKCGVSGKRVAFPFFCETKKSVWITNMKHMPVSGTLAWITVENNKNPILAEFYDGVWCDYKSITLLVIRDVIAYAPITVPDIYRENESGDYR